MNHFRLEKFSLLICIGILLLNNASSGESRSGKRTYTDTTTKTYLALGDSYIIGESVERAENFPNQLTAALRRAGFNISEPEIRARTGWTTGDLISSLQLTPPNIKTYDLVTLLIGVNNQFQGRPLEEYKSEFNLLLDEAIKYAGDKKNVIVISIPDYSVTQFAATLTKGEAHTIAKQINSFNKAQKEITLRAGVKFINITPVSRKGRKNPALQAFDGLHPSAEQYSKWVKLLLPAAKNIFSPDK